MSEVELKPCPICGKQPIWTTWATGASSVFCPTHHPEYGFRRPGYGATLELAKEAWNSHKLPGPTPAISDTAAAQLAVLLEQDAQAILDVLTVWGWIKAHGGAIYPKKCELVVSENPLTTQVFDVFYNKLAGEQLHAAAEWCRQQGGEDGE